MTNAVGFRVAHARTARRCKASSGGMPMNATNTANRIMVCVDLSETGDDALRESMRLARERPGSELHVVHVIRTDKSLHSAKKLDALSEQFRGKLDELRNHVSSVCAPSSDADPFSQEVVFHLRLGDPAGAIQQTAVDVDADLIVVGTRGRTGVERMVLGSVAESVIRTAHAPVVVAHPKDYSGLTKTDQLDPARPGEQLHAAGLAYRSNVTFTPRAFTHQSGLY